MFSSHKVRSIFLSTPCLFLFHLKILTHCIDSTWQIFPLSTSHTNTHFSNPHTIFLTFFHTLLILTNFRTTEQHTKKKITPPRSFTKNLTGTKPSQNTPLLRFLSLVAPPPQAATPQPPKTSSTTTISVNYQSSRTGPPTARAAARPRQLLLEPH